MELKKKYTSPNLKRRLVKDLQNHGAMSTQQHGSYRGYTNHLLTGAVYFITTPVHRGRLCSNGYGVERFCVDTLFPRIVYKCMQASEFFLPCIINLY